MDELLRRAIEGDVDALSDLLELHSPTISGRIDKSIGQQWRSVLDADDIMQVTFVEVFLDFDRFPGSDIDGFVAWVTRIAKNNLSDAIRGLSREKRPQPSRRIQGAVGHESYVALIEQMGGITTSVGTKAAREEMVRHLDETLKRLPPDYEQVLRLYDLEGLSGPEVAERIGRRRGAVHMLRSRALVRLRKELGPASMYFTDGGDVGHE